ncbi:hypothetical protein [Clostridium sp. DJ247]|uniref:hypothetical protein n=1 Tax=Clostridium sp. DJ247 TaxID=2726188 RepID=UPI001628B51F|nr:hypothetical protein [Clostridium sp. DJ247]MBC2579020.1 hypothetical protein [Clostridium sp. DJ247]
MGYKKTVTRRDRRQPHRGEELSLQNPYGTIKKLSNNKLNSADLTYAKDTMKELLMEWAK